MNLPFLKKFRKEILPSYFLVLVLRDEKVNAVVFEELEGKIQIVGQQEEHCPASIDGVSSEDFLQTLDKAISQAESTLPENIQTQKTIFGVKESWTENDQIKRDHLAKLKKASEELGLIPIGFLVNSQAIAHLLQKEEGAPVSAVLVEVNKKTLTVTLIRAGKTIETKSSQIHETIPFTVDTLLKHFNIPEILPSRIIIFNGKEDLSQEFITHTWSKSLPFLHIPQITNLPAGFDAKAVLSGAAIQMGFAITEGTEKSAENTEKIKRHEDSMISVDNSVSSVMGGFGFAKDMDVAKMPATSETPSFAEAAEGRQKKDMFSDSARPSEPEGRSGMVAREEEFHKTKKTVNVIKILSKINFKKILPIFTKIPKGKMTVLLPLISLLIIGAILSYFFLLKATIEITVDPKIVEQNRNILFSAESETDASKNIIKGEFISVSEEGNASTQATGKKDVGTKAKGTVTIFNSQSESETIPEGTIIKAPNGLSFLLDSSVTIKAVASRSADEPPPPSQTATVNVTASQMGKESNLPSGTKLTISSFDIANLVAKNDNPFSGGTKKEVTVVSEKDLEKLENDLVKQLEDKAKEQLTKKIDQNKILLPVFISNSLSKKSLNSKLGEEANQVTLTGTVEYQGISYNKDDLIAFSKNILNQDIPENQEIDYNNIKTSVKDIIREDDEEVEANLNIKALLLPKIDEEKLAKDVKGKSFKDIEDLLFKLPQVSDVDILHSPKIPFLPKSLPMREKNIKIIIKING